MTEELTGERKLEGIRDRYIEVMAPLFFPDDPIGYDIIRYFASLLRVLGAEDKGWDPYAESRAILEDINSLMKLDLPQDRFQAPDRTVFRLGLLSYNHIVEMDAPYEVLTNLLRFKLSRGYSPNPFYQFLTENQKKRLRGTELFPRQKIDIIKKLGDQARSAVGQVIEEFYRSDLRNAISHSDFILTDDSFRCRSGGWTISYRELDDLITKAKAFIGGFFGLEREARRAWGQRVGKAIPYDLYTKG
jgi:hypothetical protein